MCVSDRKQALLVDALCVCVCVEIILKKTELHTFHSGIEGSSGHFQF